MAVLDTTNRQRVRFAFLRAMDAVSIGGIGKADVQAAVDATDTWLDTAAASVPATSFNAALPQPFRTAANPAAKAVLLAYVCLRRAGQLPVAEDQT